LCDVTVESADKEEAEANKNVESNQVAFYLDLS
jgi:hypothetical protein